MDRHVLHRIARLNDIRRAYAVLVRIGNLDRWRLRIGFVATTIIGELRVNRHVDRWQAETACQIAQRIATWI